MIKPDRTIIRLSFPHPVYGTFTPIRVEYEYPLGPDDNDQDALDDGKRRAEEWFTSRYPPLDAGQSDHVPVIEGSGKGKSLIEQMIGDIGTCKELKVLESYELMVRTSKDHRLKSAYDEQYKKLSK